MSNNKLSITSKRCEDHFGCQEVFSFLLSNGVVDISITNYGCTIMSIFAPGKNGVKENVVSGFEKPEDYLNPHPYFGCIVGRYANRIEFGKFTLNGKIYQLPVNNGPNHLHGGITGFNKKVWAVKQVISNAENAGVVFTYTSAHLEEGYPGTMNISVTYLLNCNNELVMQYQANCDAPTIINLTNHTYFNLSGFRERVVYDHLLKVNADYYTIKNENNVPSGEIVLVKNSPLDFRQATRIGENITKLVADKGYDHNFVLKNSSTTIALAATLQDPTSGRVLEVLTNQPGIQVYTANWWDGSITGAQCKPYQQHGAVALETQNFPDAPNHTNFPSPVLSPGEVYSTTTIYRLLTI